MNLKQKRVLLIGAGLVALIFLFPPWDYYDSNTSGRSPAGYHFFLKPPDPKSAHFRYQVRPEHVRVRKNDIRLIIQLLITIPTTLGLALLLRHKQSMITIIIGILFLLFAAFVIGFVIWMVVSEGLGDGVWALP